MAYDFSGLIGDQRQRYQNQDVYGSIGQALMQTKRPQFENPWMTFAANLGTSAFGAGLTAYGQKRVDARTADYANTIAQALQQPTIEGRNEMLSGNAETAPIVAALGLQDLQTRQDLANAGNAAFIQERAKFDAQTGRVPNFLLQQNPDGTVRVSAPQEEQPIGQPIYGQQPANDPMINDFRAGLEEGQRLGLPFDQRQRFALDFANRKQTIRQQSEQQQAIAERQQEARQETTALKRETAARAEVAENLKQAMEYDRQAQQMAANLETRGDAYTGLIGGLQFAWDKNMNPEDPKLQAAAELNQLALKGVRDMRSDSQIHAGEQKMIVQSLPGATSGRPLIESNINKLKLGAEINRLQANYILQRSEAGVDPTRARQEFTQAYSQIPLYTKDPVTNENRWLKPEEFRMQFSQQLAPSSGAVQSLNSGTTITGAGEGGPVNQPAQIRGIGAPAGVPAGARPTGRTSGGKPVFELNGRKFVAE